LDKKEFTFKEETTKLKAQLEEAIQGKGRSMSKATG